VGPQSIMIKHVLNHFTDSDFNAKW